MRRMLKYPLQLGRTFLQVNDGTRFRSVDWQGGQLVIWAEVPAESPAIIDAIFEAVPTGVAVPSNGDFIGTAQHPTLLDGDPLVLHVYLLH